MNHNAKNFEQLPYVGPTTADDLSKYLIAVGGHTDPGINKLVMDWLNSINPKNDDEWTDFLGRIHNNVLPNEPFNYKAIMPVTPSLPKQPDFDLPAAEAAMAAFLTAMGQDITRDGLQETPKRYTKFMAEFLSPPPFEFKTFDGEHYDEMVTSANIPFFSLCEHHLAPFFGFATVSYIPNGNRIVGISKLARTVESFARGLQNQERITQMVAKVLMAELVPKGVAVSITARHLCQEMRGAKKHGIETTTTCLLGVYKTESETRREFLALTKK